MPKEKHLMFSLTSKDFDFQFFTVGGHGGSGKDTSNTGARCIHRDSGAVGEARETRSQRRNKEKAFERCAISPKFKTWHRLEVARRLGQLKNIDQIVDESMQLENLRIEYE